MSSSNASAFKIILSLYWPVVFKAFLWFERANRGSPLRSKVQPKYETDHTKGPDFHMSIYFVGYNCPMSLSQITPTLFLSGADAPMNQALVTRKGITLIVNATLSHTCPFYPGVECIRIAVSDLPNARLGDHFDHVAARIHNNRAGGTLVHCAAGMSRSPALIMAYLMKYKGVTLRQAHNWVKESRPYISLNTGFWAQLLDYEKKLYGKNTVKVAEPLNPLPKTPKLASKFNMRKCPPSPRLSRLRRYTSTDV